MHRNPFLPAPTYTPHQPPPPAGPPPAAPSQPSYWPQPSQPPVPGSYPPYNGQWAASQPAQSPQNSALYANYGYGGQQQQWQQQQQQQQRPQFIPPPPAAPPAPQQPTYSPYQPQAAAGSYSQPYVPPQAPVPLPQTYQQAPSAPTQPPQTYYPPPPAPGPRPPIGNPVHHPSPQHLPPAKRPRFDRPNGGNNRGPAIPQPSFQPPPPSGPIGPQGSFNCGPPQGPAQSGGRGGTSGGGRGGAPGRGGPPPRGAKSGFIANRGGANGMRGGGRGGGSMLNVGGEGRGSGSGRGGSLRGHGSRGGFGGGRRGGGSFGGPNIGGSFRGGRGGGSGYHGGGRSRNANHGGAGPTPLGPSASFNAGSKKDENRRTLTDFKIVGFELPDMNWSWGVVPKPVETPSKEPDSVQASEVHEHSSSPKEASQEGKLADAVEAAAGEASEQVKDGASGSGASASGEAAPTTDAAPERSPTVSVAEPAASAPEPSAKDGPPPARLRIYFHTPASYDDSLNLGSSAWTWDHPDATRKGKRKKGDDDDEDDVELEEGRIRPRPPGEEHDRASVAPSVEMRSGSVAPSVAETMSEGDWLMAAFGGERGPEGGEHEFEDAEDTGASTFAHGEAASSSHHTEGLFEHLEPVPEAHNDASEHPSLNDSGSTPVTQTATAVAEPASESITSEAPVATAAEQPTASFTVGEASVAHNSSSASRDVSDGSDPKTNAASDLVHVEESLSAKPDSDQAEAAKDDDDPPGLGISNGSLKRTASFASTVPDDDGLSEQGVTDLITNRESGSPDTVPDIQEPPIGGDDEFSLGGTETSAATTLVSTNTSGAYGDLSFASVSVSTRPDSKSVLPSANRLSISYADGNKRLLINAEVVKTLKVFRAESRVEVQINLEHTDSGDLKGILVEELSEETKLYRTLDGDSSTTLDETVPPLSRAEVPSTTTLVVHLDTERPLSEPKWVKTGDVQEWIKGMLGRMFWAAGDAADGWEKRIEVADPDPAPTIWTILETWAEGSLAGLPAERQRFLKTHMSEPDNILEILLRLVRGERATPHSHNAPTLSTNNVAGPLLSVLTEGTAHSAQQTHVSLAVLAMFRMTLDFAKQASGEKGTTDAQERMGEIVRCLPTHLVHKSLDGIFREWKLDKKGNR